MKKFFAIAMVLCLGLFFVGCGNDTKPAVKPKPDVVKPKDGAGEKPVTPPVAPE